MQPRERLAARVQAASIRWSVTPRQKDVLALLAQGAANKDIAQALNCSVKTVEAHVTAILAKAGLDSRAAVMARVWMDGDDPGSPSSTP